MRISDKRLAAFKAGINEVINGEKNHVCPYEAAYLSLPSTCPCFVIGRQTVIKISKQILKESTDETRKRLLSV